MKNACLPFTYFAVAVLFGTFRNMFSFNDLKPAGKFLLVIYLCAMQTPAQAQSGSFNFRQLGTGMGLSDPAVRCITQDKYGYIWIGTANGLDRFNGYDVTVMQHEPGDSFSLQDNLVPALLTDDAGNLWIAQQKGIYRYDYITSHFMLQPGSTGISAHKMLQANKTDIYLATGNGLVLFNTAKGTFTWLKDSSNNGSLLNRRVNDFCINRKGYLYIAVDSGVIQYNTANKRTERIMNGPLKNIAIDKITIDTAGNIWMSYGDNGLQLLKTTDRFDKFTACDQFVLANTSLTDNRITSVFADKEGRLWLTTSQFGLCLYNAAANTFISYKHDPLQVTSISDNLTTSIFQDRQGYIWVGTEVSGVNYFHPDKTFFRSIQPSFNQSPTLPDYWCRAAGEDKNGNLWLGTARGIAKYDTKKNNYTLYQNTTGKNNALQYNSIRSVVCDGDIVWIGTGNGLNRFHLSTGKMDFLGDKENIPLSFFWAILKDHENNIWFGTRDGIYRYRSGTHNIENFFADPELGTYARNNTISLYEDSRHRMWFGFLQKGLLMYDAASHKTRYWAKDDAKQGSLSDNHITSVTEDKTGVIWVATLEGLNAWNEKQDSFTQYLRGHGMASEKTAALLVDDKNRLWLAGSRGLYMLDSARKFFTNFDMSNGLPSVDFNYQGAFRMQNGDFVYPTLKGFVQFTPGRYSNKNNIPYAYIASFRVYGKAPVTFSNFEERKNISLSANENFFSFDMIALNYGNPKEIWYAHRLEPFDKEWVYSKDRTANYTNVPGGDYSLHFKTSTDFNNWNTPEKTLHLHLDTVFYKTWWFRMMTALLVAGILILLYTFRISQREKVYKLQSKANALEKEKVLVMYESLKQQLNPHFLFNSLTSLSGLITSNPVHAKQFLDRMSKIYRYILKSRDNETVPLAEEIKLAETYTQLQQTRFKAALQIHINIAEEYLHRKIAPVTIQNLIENAIKHNIVDVSRPLAVDIFIEDDQLVIRNNLQKKKFVETSNKQGLSNLRSLYHYLSGKALMITEDEHYFTVKIPLI